LKVFDVFVYLVEHGREGFIFVEGKGLILLDAVEEIIRGLLEGGGY